MPFDLVNVGTSVHRRASVSEQITKTFPPFHGGPALLPNVTPRLRVRENLHVVLAMSPIGESFRNRTRMYPGLVNCTTIDWFQHWPADALVEVATKFIQDIQVGTEGFRIDSNNKVIVAVQKSGAFPRLSRLVRHSAKAASTTNSIDWVSWGQGICMSAIKMNSCIYYRYHLDTSKLERRSLILTVVGRNVTCR